MTCDPHGCEGCSMQPQMQQLGIAIDRFDHVIALAGNPNTGKSTVFNALTGLRQHTGNWPGKTVTRAEGAFSHEGVRYKLVDLPGTYSLLSASVDEEIARNFILFGQPDCTIVVADATALQRNLNLALQVLEITDKVVVCVNLMDEAKRRGIHVDLPLLQERLGVPVVGTAARRHQGLDTLVTIVSQVVNGDIVTSPYITATPPSLQRAVQKVTSKLQDLIPGLPNARWVAYRLIEGDLRLRQSLESGELAQLVAKSTHNVESEVA